MRRACLPPLSPPARNNTHNFFTIYLESGQKEVVSYAYGLLIMLVPWLAYIFAIIFLTRE